MAAPVDQTALIKGGWFLIEDRLAAEIFTPEDFSDEHRMIAETTREFVDKEVLPNIAKLERHDWNLSRQLIKKAADLGLVGACIPEEYGGLGLDQTTGALVGENLGRSASFGTTMGAQCGLGLLPIIFFGSKQAKDKYLSKIASGNLVTAYALTEANAGSDALAGKATAKLSEDGAEYILNGEKMWITNGGYADIFIVFAKLDGDKFSAFIVERQPGLSSGAEEHKLGIKGSSTTALALADVRTPRENLLGEVGKGHKIALNILNIGRFKLGAMCLGAMKRMMSESIRYAKERHQFGRPISSFGAIKAKLAEMAIRTWVGESMIYRTLGMIEAGIGAIQDPADLDATLRTIENYAVECSIVKVALSEDCDYIADEMMQIFGGYGYSSDYPAERSYRDSRINRIFEGTNEINRLLIPGRLIKSALGRELELIKIDQAPMSGPNETGTLLGDENKLLGGVKKAALLTLHTAAQRYSKTLGDQQEVLIGIADIIIDTYAMESAILRAQKLVESRMEVDPPELSRGMPKDPSTYLDMAKVYSNSAMERVAGRASTTMAAMAEGEDLNRLLALVKSYTDHTPFDSIAAKQRIADEVLVNGEW